MAIGPPGFTTRTNSPQCVGNALRRHVHEGAHRPQRVERGANEGQGIEGRIDDEESLCLHDLAILRTEVDTNGVETVLLPEKGVETGSSSDVGQRPAGLGSEKVSEAFTQPVTHRPMFDAMPADRLRVVVSHQLLVHIHGGSVRSDPEPIHASHKGVIRQ